MSVRNPFRAGTFYPDNKDEVMSLIEKYESEYELSNDINEIIGGGIVPHAGWIFSGSIAFNVYKTLKEIKKKEIDTIIIFGAVHLGGVRNAVVYAKGSWATPIGNVEVDEELAEMILNLSDLKIIKDESVHQMEHSIEVQIPMIHHIFPKAKILPIMTPPIKEMKRVGEKIGHLLTKSKKNVIVIGSTDLTHYGPRFGLVEGGRGEQGLEWMKQNDRRIIKMMTQMNIDDIINETQNNKNACGGGAIVSTLSAVKEMGAYSGKLLEYTTSYDIRPYGKPTDAVGYAGIVY